MVNVVNKFGVLFSIRIKHPYFRDEICPYLSIEPDLSTRTLYKNMHFVTKNYPGEISIITPLDRIDSTEVNHQMFLLEVTDSRIFNITNLDFSGFPKKIFYFSNTSKSATLSIKKCNLINGMLSIPFEEGKMPSKIKIVSAGNVEIFNGDISNTASQFLHDMTPFQAGMYTVVSTFPKTGMQKPQTQLFYYSSLMREKPVLGLIDIDPVGIINLKEDSNKIYAIELQAPK